MFAIVGILVVFGAIAGGYLMEKGILAVLMQPAELLIIGGAAIGTILIANPRHILMGIVQGMVGVFAASKFTGQRYLDSLKMLYELFNHARRNGLAALETDIEEPEKSKIFSACPSVLNNHHAVHFICDTMRTACAGVVDPFDMDQMMELDMEVHRSEEHTSELQSLRHLVCRLLLEKKK